MPSFVHFILRLLRPRAPLSPVHERIRKAKWATQNELAQLAADRQLDARKMQVKRRSKGNSDKAE